MKGLVSQTGMSFAVSGITALAEDTLQIGMWFTQFRGYSFWRGGTGLLGQGSNGSASSSSPSGGSGNIDGYLGSPGGSTLSVARNGTNEVV